MIASRAEVVIAGATPRAGQISWMVGAFHYRGKIYLLNWFVGFSGESAAQETKLKITVFCSSLWAINSFELLFAMLKALLAFNLRFGFTICQAF